MRAKKLWALCALLGLAWFAAGPDSASAAAPVVVITVSDEPAKFVPARVVIKAGDTVEWKNTGAILHSATDDPAKAGNSQAVSAPSGAALFDSGFLNPGAVYQHTFAVPGTYRYVCLPHQAQGMTGEILVKPR